MVGSGPILVCAFTMLAPLSEAHAAVRVRNGAQMSSLTAPQLKWVGAVTMFFSRAERLSSIELSVGTALAIVGALEKNGWTPDRLSGAALSQAVKDDTFRSAWREAGLAVAARDASDEDARPELEWMAQIAHADELKTLALGRELTAAAESFNKQREESKKALGGIGQLDDEKLERLGSAYRMLQGQKWEAVGDLEEAGSPASFVEAVEGVAEISALSRSLGRSADESVETGRFRAGFQDAVSANRAKDAVRMAGLIAAGKGFSSYQGKPDQAVEAFGRLLRQHGKAEGFVDSRKYEFRDQFQVVLMLGEALRLSEPVADQRIKEALAEETVEFLRSTQGILSWTDVPLRRVMDVIAPGLEKIMRASPAAADAIREGFRRAKANPKPLGVRGEISIAQELRAYAMVVGGILLLINTILWAADLALWQRVIVNLGFIASSLTDWGKSGEISLGSMIRSRLALQRAQARLKKLAFSRLPDGRSD